MVRDPARIARVAAEGGEMQGDQASQAA